MITRQLIIPLIIFALMSGLIACGTQDGQKTPSFSMSLNPAELSVVQGQAGTVEVELEPRNGFAQAVTLQVTALPTGVTASPLELAVGETRGSLRFEVATNAALGTNEVTLKASAGSFSAEKKLKLEVTERLANQAPIIKRFDAQPESSVVGSPVLFVWEVEDDSASLTCTIDVDMDADVDYTLDCSAAKAGAVQGLGSQSHRYEQTGDYSVSLVVTDEEGESASETLTLSVDEPVPDNTAPTAKDDAFSLVKNSTLDLDVLSNDSDADGDSLAIGDFDGSSTQGGSVVLSDRLLRYTPKTDFVGTDTFSYTLSDAKGGSDKATVTLTVNDVDPDNAPPSIAPVSDQTVLRNTQTPRSADVSLQISDADDDAFSVKVDSSDSSVIQDTTLRCTTTRCTLKLTPSATKTAEVTLDVTIKDGRGGEAKTSFQVNVVPHLVKNRNDNSMNEALSPDSLRDAIRKAIDGDVIGFDKEGVFSSARTITLKQQLELSKDLTIEGTGRDKLTISGDNKVRVFKVTNESTVVLNDLMITKGFAPVETFFGEPEVAGGGIFVNAGSDLSLYRVSVTENTAYRQIPSEGSEGGATFRGLGGGIANIASTVKLTESIVSENVAFNGGGGIISTSSDGKVAALALKDSHLFGNEARAGSGGAIFSNSDVVLDNSVVGGVSEQEANQAITGGGLFVEASDDPNLQKASLTIENGSKIIANKASQHGGGIMSYIFSITVKNSEISRNRANDDGGAFFVHESDVEVLDKSILKGNTADIDGNEIGNGGAVFNSLSKLMIDNSVVGGSSLEEQNKAVYGGGIYSGSDSELIIRNGSRVSGNLAVKDGGGVYLKGVMTMDKSTIGNSNPDDATDGGNKAENGGGLAISGLAGLTVQDKSYISGNTASQHGGGVHNTSKGVNVERIIISGNNALNRGGGIYNEGTLTIANQSEVSSNASSQDGGGIWNGGTFFLLSTRVFSNEATGNGGGIWNTFELGIYEGSHIYGNTAANGAGLFNGSAANIHDTIIGHSEAGKGNVAFGNGGGIWSLGLLRLEDSSLIGNMSETGDGGGLFQEGAPLGVTELIGTTVQDNKADSGGGGIYQADGDMVIKDGSAVRANTAEVGRGGGIAVARDVKLEGSAVTNNKAAKGGGVFLFSTGSFDMDSESRLVGNEATDASPSGGGILSSFMAQLGSGVTCDSVEDNVPDDIVRSSSTETTVICPSF